MKAGDEIRLVKDNLAFAFSLSKGASAGQLPAAALARPSVVAAARETDTQRQKSGIVRGAANLARSAFALSALQAQRSLERAFATEPIREEWPELRAARCSMFLIGRAVEKSILQPVWDCPQPYQRIFHIRRLSFTLNATRLDGCPLSWDDFGGLESFLALLEYCASSARAAEEIGESRMLPRRLPSINNDAAGIIGGPASLTKHVRGASSISAPSGHPGERDDSLLADGLPPRERPLFVEVFGTALDSWDDDTTLLPATPGAGGGGVVRETGSATATVETLPSFTAAPAQDLVRLFVDERCEIGEDKRILAGDLYQDFLTWCQERNRPMVSQRAFGLRLSGMGYRRKRRGHGKHWWEGLGRG